MVSRNLVICDQEVRYAAALAEVFMKAKELALGVQVCNSVEQTVKLQEESPVDILLEEDKGRECVRSGTVGKCST